MDFFLLDLIHAHLRQMVTSGSNQIKETLSIQEEI